MIMIAGCKDPVEPEPPAPSITEITIENVNSFHSQPYKIKYLFSLRDQYDHAISVTPEELSDFTFRIYENSNEIDYTESNVQFKNSASFNMDIVLVLDFTLSMEETGGIDKMIEGANSIIDALEDSHRIAIVEFHHNEPGNDFSVIQDFTYDKEMAKENLQAFVDKDVYNGFTLCWDAMYEGMNLFSAESSFDIVRAMVVLTDGFDNNSLTTPSDLIKAAKTKKVQIYCIGYGDMTYSAIDSLQTMADSTDAHFYQNYNIEEINIQFDQIIKDLGGNYMLSYTTSRLQDYKLEIDLGYKTIEANNNITEEIFVADIAGPITTGILYYDNFILNNYQLDFDLMAEHLPAGIDSLRIYIDTYHQLGVTKILPQDGGIIADWSQPNQQFDGYYALGGSPTGIGEFGGLLHISIFNINQTNLNVPITLDSSIYPDQIFLYSGNDAEIDGNNNWTKSIIFGSAVELPIPQNHSVVPDTLNTLSWTYTNNVRTYIYNVKLDSTLFFLEPVLDTLVTETSLTFERELESDTKYYWRVDLIDDQDADITIDGLLWEFTTEADTTSVDTLFVE